MDLEVGGDLLVELGQELLNSAAQWRRWREPMPLPVAT